MKTLAATLFFLGLSACQTPPSTPSQAAPLPWPVQAQSWRSDATWYDGTAEKCVYRATRTIYNIERHYLATAYTNKQFMDAGSTTKSATGQGIEVFKHHWSERIETEKYDYDFSSASFSACADLAPFKLTVGTQEDCGASFKQVWRAGDELHSLESVYFPDGGISQGKIARTDIVFDEALPLVLRDFPFGSEQAWELWVLPGQKSTKRASFEPLLRRVVPRGEVRIELPMGSMLAERLDLCDPTDEAVLASYWFASDATGPLMHAMLRYEGPGGVSYNLESHERTAYWKR